MTETIQDWTENLPEDHRSGFVAVIGRPNVGKSTLMNAFLGQKIAIASHRPQTTRIRQLGIMTEPAHQIIFVDTPGIIRKTMHALDEFMLETAMDALSDADVVLFMVDGSEAPSKRDRDIAERLQTLPDSSTVILGINKLDIMKPAQVLSHTTGYRELLPNAAWLAFSAENKAGVDELLSMIVAALPLGPRYYPDDQVTDVYLRDLASELVREQLLLQLRDEIPHAVAVEVIEYKERANGKIYIGANIYVERDTHKQIVIGRGGQQLKRIGAAARPQIEKLVDAPVYLELWVKVEPKWRRSERMLRKLGYSKSS